VKLTPIALKTLRRRPWQAGHSVIESSVNVCWMSNAFSHSVQR